MAQCAPTALAGALPRPCVGGARGRFGRFGAVPGVVSLPFPPSCPACPALHVAGRPVRVSITLARWYPIPHGLCVPRARSGCPSGSPRVPFACVCARANAASAPPPPGWCGVCTSRGPGTGRWYGRSTWSVPLRVSCPGPLLRLACLGGGAVRSRFPLTWVGAVGAVGVRPGGKGFGGNGLGGLVWVWVGLAWVRYFAPSLPTAAAAAAAGEAPVARAGSFPRSRAVLGAAAWPVEAVARVAGATVATPRAPSPLPSAAAADLGDAPGSCARATPRVGGVPGPRSGPRRGSLVLRSPLPARLGPPPGRGGRATCLGGGGGHLGWLRLPGRRPGVGGGRPGLPSWRPNQHRRLRQPPLLALRGALPRPLPGDGGAGAGPAVVAVVALGGAIGVCHHCYPGRHAWWQLRPSHYLPVRQCRAVRSAVQCSAGGRGGGDGGAAVASAPYGRDPAAIHQHWEGRRPTRRATAPRLGQGSGPWAPGGSRVVPGGAALGGPP